LSAILKRGSNPEYDNNCTGDIETCKNDECMICGVRDCPHDEPLHYHHDGCPACYVEKKIEEMNDEYKRREN